jgi:hypothetical protein
MNDYTTRPDASQVRIAVYLCPSEVNDRERVTPNITHYPLNVVRIRPRVQPAG